ncbi:hypothetical protein [Planococcus rifietoensis]|uniref:hypothetical protein n=1 Tax=Planococcus rifietoensis TaxID=200991 RepID=UPI00384E2EE6
MTDAAFLEKNGFPETNEALTDLAETLAMLKLEITNQGKEYIESFSGEELSEAEKIIWNRQMLKFILRTNLAVMKARVEILENKL